MNKIWKFIKILPKYLWIVIVSAILVTIYFLLKSLGFIKKRKIVRNKSSMEFENTTENVEESGRIEKAINNYDKALKELLK